MYGQHKGNNANDCRRPVAIHYVKAKPQLLRHRFQFLPLPRKHCVYSLDKSGCWLFCCCHCLFVKNSSWNGILRRFDFLFPQRKLCAGRPNKSEVCTQAETIEECLLFLIARLKGNLSRWSYQNRDGAKSSVGHFSVNLPFTTIFDKHTSIQQLAAECLLRMSDMRDWG